MTETINPDGWPRPRGYANGIVATGRFLFVAGQIGWNERGAFESDLFIDQAAQALRNVESIVRAAGGEPHHIVRLTWYITDKVRYQDCLQDLALVYRGVMGKHYPAMTLVQVAALLEDRALVEIEATAVLPDK